MRRGLSRNRGENIYNERVKDMVGIEEKKVRIEPERKVKTEEGRC